MKIHATAYSQSTKLQLLNAKFEIRRNRCLVVLGSSGAGKTLLLKALSGAISGGVRADAKIIGSRNSNMHEGVNPGEPLPMTINFNDRYQCAFVPQSGGLFPPFMEIGHVLYDLQTRWGGQEVDTIDLINRLGLKADEILNRKPGTFSGGELRRLVIVAALISKPQFMLFDEPTVGLDKQRISEFLDILRALPSTNIIATHNLEFASKIGDDVAFLSAGECLESDRAISFLRAQKTETGRNFIRNWDKILPKDWHGRV